MAIAVGNTSSGQTPGTVTTLTVSHTVASGSNLLIATFGKNRTGGGFPTVTATYGGVSMATVPSSQQDSSGGGSLSFYLINPSAGTADIVFSFSSSIGIDDAIGGGIDFSGVNTDTGLVFDAVALATGSGTSNTVSPLSNTTIESDLIFASSCLDLNSSQTPTNGQTEAADLTAGSMGLSFGYLAATQGTTTIGWSFSSTTYFLHAFAIRPAGIACIAPSADLYMRSDTATTNYDSAVNMDIGENNAAVSTNRAWTKPAFTNIPTGATFSTAYFRLTPYTDVSSNARTLYAHRCLRDVVSTQTTWNIWKTSNNWGTAGGSNATTDYEGGTVLGSVAVPANPTLNTALEMSLTASEFQKFYDGTYTNNGIILFVDTQTNDMVRYAPIEGVTPTYHPRFVIQYTTPVNAGWVMIF